MSYSQPDPAEETTAAEAPEQPDTDPEELEADGTTKTSLEIDSEDVPTGGRDTSDDTEGGGQ